MMALEQFVLTEHGVFLTTDRHGDIPLDDPGSLGLYYRDMRFLSGFMLRCQGNAALQLGIEDQGYAATLTYDAKSSTEEAVDAQAHVLLRRRRYVSAPSDAPPALHEQITVVSYERQPVRLDLTFSLRADFRDMFAVRGFMGIEQGSYAPVAQPAPDRVVLAYTGRDAVARRTDCHFRPAPSSVTTDDAGAVPGVTVRFALELQPRRPAVIDITLALLSGDVVPERAAEPTSRWFEAGLAALRTSHRRWSEQDCAIIETDNATLNALFAASIRDLRLLLLEQTTGPMLAAGIPWFAVPFGRDSIIAALELLAINPDVAVGTLRFLAARQGTQLEPERDEEPGKIMHELRSGEAVRTGAAPFGPYYGSVDATPLFLVLLGQTLHWVDDDALWHELEPSARAALRWLDEHGDADHDGYVEFARKAGRGLSNQGWKDSGDSLQFSDGSFPEAPIALVEVQGYVYEARLAAAALLARLGDGDGAATQREKAASLRSAFNRDFWLADELFLAQALDAHKRPVPAATSNAGHCLWSGIVDDALAESVARRVLAPDLCSGWGIRTLSSHYPSYNPTSYHNGSVWPHDTAIAVAGLKRYRRDHEAAQVFQQVVAAAAGQPGLRLPELYCGLSREAEERAPVPYPVSCSPQAWSAGSVLLMLQSMLGLEADAAHGRLRLRPVFPEDLHYVQLRRLRVGKTQVGLEVKLEAGGAVQITRTSEAGGTYSVTARIGEDVVVPIIGDADQAEG